jgi:hypothetical protein
MWLVPSHLNFVHLFNLSCESLELLCEFLFLCLILCGLLPECIQYLHCNLVVDHICALCLSLCHVLICIFFLRDDLDCSLLERFHLSLVLLLLCLRNYEFFLQLLHILCSFDVLSDRHHLLPLLEVPNSCVYLLLFLVPLVDLLILL